MADGGLDIMWRVESVCEVHLGAGVLQLRVPAMVVGVIIDRHCVADGVEVTHWVISATRELFSEDEGVEFWCSIVEATELPAWEISQSQAGMEMHFLAGERREFRERLRFC